MYVDPWQAVEGYADTYNAVFVWADYESAGYWMHSSKDMRVYKKIGMKGQESEILPHSGGLVLLFSSSYARQSNHSVLHSSESKIWFYLPRDYLWEVWLLIQYE